ncbi:Transposase [Shigella dysenteriae 1617]|uniref:Transposase n=1 Tax=Shigella dysenteriae 1617 TaxID=754093 RepID=A0A0A6ZU58_SHIDY|nr:Transposase [Shigella dysenteriae 1617]
MAVTAAKSVMAFRVLTMAVDLCRLTTRTMNVNAGHERTSKARIIHQIQLIRGITSKARIIHQIQLIRGITRLTGLISVKVAVTAAKSVMAL